MLPNEYIKEPAYLRFHKKNKPLDKKRGLPLYIGDCQCGGILNKWENTGQVFCRSCSNPKKYLSSNK